MPVTSQRCARSTKWFLTEPQLVTDEIIRIADHRHERIDHGQFGAT
ncbi:hypothetical protein [[Mycobacterium] zoologicum]|nr:hypothetical protein [Mycolicibacter sp. MYC101]MEB3064081.1 hypothetical protein [Mycolicibacter sp. MYC101]